jgi:hypothetical protein
MIRPELRRAFRVHAELLAHLAVALAGLWLATRGGWILAVLGGVVMLAAALLAHGAWRRLPFRRAIAAEGLVELIEGAVRYYRAPLPGAEMALRELVEIRLVRQDGRAVWRLRNEAGDMLAIPADAAGAGALADGFAALPGFRLGEAAQALQAVAAGRATMHAVWRRPG